VSKNRAAGGTDGVDGPDGAPDEDAPDDQALDDELPGWSVPVPDGAVLGAVPQEGSSKEGAAGRSRALAWFVVMPPLSSSQAPSGSGADPHPTLALP
jgi:hypothetical protein